MKGFRRKKGDVEKGDEVSHEYEKVGDSVGVEVPFAQSVPMNQLSWRSSPALGCEHEEWYCCTRATQLDETYGANGPWEADSRLQADEYDGKENAAYSCVRISSYA